MQRSALLISLKMVLPPLLLMLLILMLSTSAHTNGVSEPITPAMAQPATEVNIGIATNTGFSETLFDHSLQQAACFSFPMSNYTVIGSAYGAENAQLFPGLLHAGVDWAASAGTPVFAVADGEVIFVGSNWNPGNFVIARHNTTEGIIYSFYGHIVSNVQQGTPLTRGQQVGTLWEDYYNGQPNHHLHWEIRTFPEAKHGYTATHPDNVGYKNPVTFVERYACGNELPPQTPVPTSQPSEPTSPPDNPITVVSAWPQGENFSPGEEFNPNIVVQANGLSLDCGPGRPDGLQHRGGDLYDTWPIHACQSVGDNRYRIYFNTSMRAPDGDGEYRSRWQIWKHPNHLDDAIELWFTVGTAPDPNRPPDVPILTRPQDGIRVGNQQAPELCWSSVTDPDGDSVEYFTELFRLMSNQRAIVLE